MYEGEPVPHDWSGDWAGFDACRDCFESYTRFQSNPEALSVWFDLARKNSMARGGLTT